MTDSKTDLKRVEAAVGKMTGKEEQPKESQDLDPVQVMSKAERLALVAQLLDKGRVASRLVVRDAEPGRYYSWIRDRDQDIQRALALGFRLETEAGEGLHGTGDEQRRVGDLILVSCPQELRDAIDAVRTERKATRSMMGKKDYLRAAQMNPDVPILNPLGIGEEEK